MKNWYYIVLVIFMVSCKSKAVFVENKPVTAHVVADTNEVTSTKVIQNHYNNKSDFSTLYIRSSAKYRDEKQSQSVSAEIKIKKDEKILVSVRFLGITMAKALITPKGVQYYEKINGTYFEGDYQALTQWLGTDLDFNKIQNLLIGQPIDDLTKESFTMLLLDKSYQLKTNDNKTEKSFWFDGDHFLLKKQEIVQAEKERTFEVNYPNFQDFTTAVLPSNLLIQAVQEKGKTEISIDYNSVTFNEELSFPYSVPEGYERIFIN
ncbi:DUF4292 domain-containing protein [Flavobacterium sp. XGLA_31]|uniref:DUF4292 domain-containing protein n=1 Tax=Flavobacterium sp. XGLA_31 TaxID=3447666 RepID=UPI003F3FB557